MKAKIIKRWDRIMSDIGCEHLTIEDSLSEITKIPEHYNVQKGISVAWMTKEAEYWLSCYYESGNVRCDDRADEPEIWRSETGKLKRLITFLKKFDESIIVWEPEAKALAEAPAPEEKSAEESTDEAFANAEVTTDEVPIQAPKSKVYQMVTDKIIKIIETEGKLPWQCDWFTGIISGDCAFNRVTKKAYSLLNQMLLEHTGEYATYDQWKKLGGSPRKGTGEFVVFWKMLKKEQELDDGTVKIKTIPLLRYYTVFHVSNVDGVEPRQIETNQTEDFVPDEEAGKAFSEYLKRENIKLRHQDLSNEAYYSPSGDLIRLPKVEQFRSKGGYYATALHEAIHSTGAKNRLNRSGITEHNYFGSENYGKEELIAELGSAMLLAKFGLETDATLRNASAYIKSWTRAIKSDPQMIVSASGKAEKAVEFFLTGKMPSMGGVANEV